MFGFHYPPQFHKAQKTVKPNAYTIYSLIECLPWFLPSFLLFCLFLWCLLSPKLPASCFSFFCVFSSLKVEVNTDTQKEPKILTSPNGSSPSFRNFYLLHSSTFRIPSCLWTQTSPNAPMSTGEWEWGVGEAIYPFPGGYFPTPSMFSLFIEGFNLL